MQVYAPLRHRLINFCITSKIKLIEVTCYLSCRTTSLKDISHIYPLRNATEHSVL